MTLLVPRPARRAPGPLGSARSPRTVVGTAALSLALASVLSGCGAGFSAQTNQVRIPADGMPATSGQLKVLNALIVSDGTGGKVSLSLANGAARVVATTDLDKGAVQISAIASGEQTATLAGPTTVRASTALQVGAGETSATFSGGQFRPGTYVPLSVEVNGNQRITLDKVPVVPPTGYYSSFGPTPEPSAS